MCSGLLRLEGIGALILVTLTHFPAQEGSVGRVSTACVSGGMSIVCIPINESDRTNLCGDGDAKKVDETDVLAADDHGLINQAEHAEVTP